MKGCTDQGQFSLCIKDTLLSLISVYICQATSLAKTKQTCTILYFCIFAVAQQKLNIKFLFSKGFRIMVICMFIT